MLILSNEYTESIAPSANYPQGSFKDVSSPGGTDGTPFQKAWPDDIYGFLQRIIKIAGITPSDVSDTALASDVFDGLDSIFNEFIFFDDTGSGTANAIEVDAVGAVPEALFDGQLVLFKVDTTNTGAVTIDVAGLGADDVTNDDGTALTGGELVAGTYVQLVYNLGSTRFEIASKKAIIKVGQFTRDTTIASGLGPAITGVGFKPSSLITMTIQDASPEAAWGFVDPILTIGIGFQNTNFTAHGKAFYDYQSSGVIYQAVIDTFDDDGFTPNWSRVGAPSGTIDCFYIAFS